MNGAESLVRTLVGGGVDVCFTNPGTSEMHFVAALDRVEGMRCVLGLFEGVVTGAADGYARMADKPAATLLHLGPGLGNGFANLHNARRAMTPIVNIVGDHATYHRNFDAPLTSDIEGIARPVSHWVKTSPDAKSVAKDGAEAITASMTAPGQIATLILPADTAWNDSDGPAEVEAAPARPMVSEDALLDAAAALRSGEPTLLLLTGQAIREEGLRQAGRIAAKTGCKVMAMTSNGRMARGAGRFACPRIPYPIDQALGVLQPFRHIILVGAKPPVGFFAYPGKPSELHPQGCQIHRLARPGDHLLHALEWLAAELDAPLDGVAVQKLERPQMKDSGPLTIESIALTVAALMPENAIIADESVTSGRNLPGLTMGAPPHDWLQVPGGSIGGGMPMATGAAIACPDRKVINLEGDGSGMYTLQALWTQAREGLNVLTVIFSNRSYAILKGELMNVGAENPGRKALDMLDLGRPDLDWVGMARGMGVEASRATTTEEFNKQFAAGLASQGPVLIEAVI